MDRRQQLVSELMDLCHEITWLNKPVLEKALSDYTLSEIEMIEHIALIPYANVTKLAAASYMTRGAISKLAKKLIKKELIESYQQAENKKEIYFRLTKSGQEINQIHQELHQTFLERDKTVFQHMTDDEFDTVFRFIGRYRYHLKNITEE
jgi:DNA-binding MarR family transcriptional regulator